MCSQKLWSQMKKGVAMFLAVLLVLQVWPWQESAYAASPPDQRRFIRVEPRNNFV